MPKRKSDRSKYSNKRQRRCIIYSSSSSDSDENPVEGTPQGEDIITVLPDGDPATAAHDDTTAPGATTPTLEPRQPEQPPPPAQPEHATLDPEVLVALGEAPNEQPMFGANIHPSLAERWLPLLKQGLTKVNKENILKEYVFPDNCRLLKAPTLNPEIYSVAGELVRNRDKHIQIKQDQLGLGITAINKAMTILLQGEDKLQAIKVLSDSCRILTDVHFMETEVRKKLITPTLDKSFLPMIKDQDRDDTLYGNKLSEKIKASKAIEKQGHLIKKPVTTPRASSLPSSSTAAASTSRARYAGNWTAPPRYASSSRGGRGAQRTASYRKTANPPPAPTQPRPSTSQGSRHRANYYHTRP